jgi:hypothetical protein
MPHSPSALKEFLLLKFCACPSCPDGVREGFLEVLNACDADSTHPNGTPGGVSTPAMTPVPGALPGQVCRMMTQS